MLRKISQVVGVIVAVATCSSVSAGPATDNMSNCLIKQSTGQDRIDLIQWMVVGYSVHPDVNSVVTSAEENREGIQKNVAEVFSKLLLERCVDETRIALQEDGEIAMQNAFEALGRIAALELAQNQTVNEYLTGFAQYLDQKKIAELYQ